MENPCAVLRNGGLKHTDIKIMVEIVMEFAWVKFNEHGFTGSHIRYLEIFHRNGAVSKYEYHFAVQVLFRLLIENFKYLMNREPLP